MDIRAENWEMNPQGILVRKAAKIGMGGHFVGQIVRAGQVIDEWDCDNIVTNQGLDYVLKAAISNGVTAITTWYLALFAANYTPLAADTPAIIVTSYAELLSTAFVEGIRQTYIPVEVAQACTNVASPSTFTANALTPGTIYGAAMLSVSTCRATTGTLLAAALFGAPKSLATGDQLLLTYAFAASSI